MKESKVFDVKDFVSSRDLNSLPEGERTLIKRIHTLKECENVFERRDVIFTNEFLNYLNQIKAGLEGFISTQIDDNELDEETLEKERPTKLNENFDSIDRDILKKKFFELNSNS